MIFEQKCDETKSVVSSKTPKTRRVSWALGAIVFDFEECPLGSFPSNLIHSLRNFHLFYFILYDSTTTGGIHE